MSVVSCVYVCACVCAFVVRAFVHAFCICYVRLHVFANDSFCCKNILIDNAFMHFEKPFSVLTATAMGFPESSGNQSPL